MGQIKNIKLHIVTDIKVSLMNESQTTDDAKAKTESFNMFDFDFGPSAKNNAFLANLMKNVQLQEKFNDEDEDEDEDSDIEEVSEFEDEEEEEEEVEEEENQKSSIANTSSELKGNSSSSMSSKPENVVENSSTKKHDNADEEKDAVT